LVKLEYSSASIGFVGVGKQPAGSRSWPFLRVIWDCQDAFRPGA